MAGKRPDAAALRMMFAGKGMDIKEIAVACGATPGSVNRWLLEEGLREPRKYTRSLEGMPPEDELYRMYVEEDMRGKEIAAEYGVTDGVVEYWMRHLSIRKHKAGRNPGAAELDRLYNEEGMTCLEMAEMYGISKSVMTVWLREAGVHKAGRKRSA